MLYSADVVMAVLVVLLVARGLWDLFRSDDSPLTLRRIGFTSSRESTAPEGPRAGATRSPASHARMPPHGAAEPLLPEGVPVPR